MTRDLRTALGPTGVWAALGGIPAGEALSFGSEIEDLGYPALWINEGTSPEPFAVLGALARTTSRITLGLGIATIYARDATAAHAGARTLQDLSGGRFVMGLGVSHRSSANARGHEYARPLPAMRAYLDAYDAAPAGGSAIADPPLVIAALGPRMLALAATRTAGAFPYNVTEGMVCAARRTLDEAALAVNAAARPVLVVSLLAILADPADAIAGARRLIGGYMGQPNYRNNLLRAGFEDADLDGPSDALVHALVAMGDANEIRARIALMHAAGADHVAVIPCSAAGRQADAATARAIAPET